MWNAESPITITPSLSRFYVLSSAVILVRSFFFFFRRSPVRPFLLLFLSFSLLVSTLSRFSFVAFLRIVPRKIHGDSLAREGRDREKRGEIMKQRREKLQKSRHRKRVTTDIVFEVSNPLLDSSPDSQSSEMKINFEQRANCPFVSLQKSEYGNM